MNRNKITRLMSYPLIALLLFTLVPFSGSTSKVKAADAGQWVLIQHYDEQDPGDGNTLFYNYDEKSGYVTHQTTRTMTNIDGTFSVTLTGQCEIPPATIAGGQTVNLKVSSQSSGNTFDGLLFSNNCTVSIKGYLLWFRDINDYSHYYITSGNLTSIEKGVHYVPEDGATVSYKMDSGSKYGETTGITFEQSGGNSTNGIIKTHWIYEWRAVTPEKPAEKSSDNGTSIGKNTDQATTIGDDTKQTTITVTQVKKVKLTNKKGKKIYISYSPVSDADGYQIRYATKKSMGNAKKLTTTATKGYFINAKGKKVTFKKGKTYYVQVRAYRKDSNGIKNYGKWSGKKKVKIKK